MLNELILDTQVDSGKRVVLPVYFPEDGTIKLKLYNPRKNGLKYRLFPCCSPQGARATATLTQVIE